MNSFQTIDETTRRKNLRILVNLRGIAFCAQVAAILIAAYGLDIVLPVTKMFAVAAGLAVFNLYSLYRLRATRPVRLGDLFTGLLVDVAALTLQLAFSGGTANPFVSFYMLPVIIGAVMLSSGFSWAIYGLTLVGYLGLAVASYYQPMPAMTMPGMEMQNMAGQGLVDRSSLHMHGMMLGYAISAGVLVLMITRIRANLQARDMELEAIKARAQEEDYLVRLGLLSAGAAHELGTPLTTLSVIVKDLIDLPLPRKKADMAADLNTMAGQIERCKAIVSGILTASGDVRGEGADVRPLDSFITDIAEAWRQAHADASLSIAIDLPAQSVVADRVIDQVVVNLLDNAHEAAPTIHLSARMEAANLVITVADTGPGFTQSVLDRVGQPYVTTKDHTIEGRGRGMGLFLVSNAVRKLGGVIDVTNRGGASVTIRLPVSAIEAS